ncbi:hypothetical protein PDIP_55720 [Penicillium digitatum Pd1]|uniref:Metallo-beta-lactamase domain-containing protein n=1 Tax=Penicillium digitatum (strain Pd1 / CECT 20795) TaxID=1170230 RepID=K9FSZ0_PEND1|nr:hypothetical protein PDIP_55720 [Penicillium digitatum Pd1]EKV11622.1 hypothetical protein PDIP_55720 [Penicillium digitatum Pd1]
MRSTLILYSGARLDLPAELFLSPNIQGHERLRIPSYSFFINHPSKGRVLFDLSLRKDFQNLAPVTVNRINNPRLEWKVSVPQDVPDTLIANGIELHEIKSIFWSTQHFDHIGDTSKFPSSTELVVGPGFTKAYTPGYPDNPDSPVKSADLKGRRVIELDFDSYQEPISIGRFKAFDWFEDGSFYLLDVPGRSVGHLCGFARVKPDSFILMGGDCAHHPGEFRPSKIAPIPKDLTPLHVAVHSKQTSVCPGNIAKKINTKSDIERSPIYKAAAMFTYDVDKSQWSVEGVQELDARENVLVIIAHDGGMLSVLQQAKGKEHLTFFQKEN